MKTILLVEDEIELRDVLTEFLSDEFDRVLVAQDGLEAIGIAQNEPISVVLSDIKMPRMSGDEFLRKLRADGNFTPVVFLTGHADKDIAVSALRLGAADILDKPAPIEVIKDCLNRVIEIHRREENLNELKKHGNEKGKAQKMMGLLRVRGDIKKVP